MQILHTATPNIRLKRWPMIALESLLLIVSAWRTFDFISQVMADLPGVVAYALLSVIISEGAYLAWAKFAYPNADDGAQENVTIFMIVLNTIGLLLLSFGENLIRATSGLAWAQTAASILAFTPWAMLGLNLIGALLFGVLDDDHKDAKTRRAQIRLDRNAERDLKHAERMGHIQAKVTAIEMLHAELDGLAKELAPHYYADIRKRVTGQTLANLKRQATKIESSTADTGNRTMPRPDLETTTEFSDNGHRAKEPAHPKV